MSPTATMRTADATALAAGVWAVDRERSSVVFAGRHLLGAITGRVPDVSGTLVVAHDGTSEVDLALGLGSADFGSQLWNDLVHGQDLLGAGAHPVARYTSHRAVVSGASVSVDGELDLNGHRCPVALSVTHTPLDVTTRQFTTTAVLDRRAFGLRWDLAVVGRDRFVAREIRLEIGLVAARVA